MHCTNTLLSLVLKCDTSVHVRAQATEVLQTRDLEKNEAAQVRREHGHCCGVQSVSLEQSETC